MPIFKFKVFGISFYKPQSPEAETLRQHNLTPKKIADKVLQSHPIATSSNAWGIPIPIAGRGMKAEERETNAKIALAVVGVFLIILTDGAATPIFVPYLRPAF